jgi:hypothetical protein
MVQAITKTHRILNNRDKMNPTLRILQLHLTQISNLQTSPQHTTLITQPITHANARSRHRQVPKPNLTRFPTELSHTSKATKDHHNRAPEMVELSSHFPICVVRERVAFSNLCCAREGLMRHKAWHSTPKVEGVEHVAKL